MDTPLRQIIALNYMEDGLQIYHLHQYCTSQ